MKVLYTIDSKEILYISPSITAVDTFNFDVEVGEETIRISGRLGAAVVEEYPETGNVNGKYLLEGAIVVVNPNYTPPVNVELDLMNLKAASAAQQETINELTLLVAELLMGGGK